jgi:oligopeptide/dipeptide ABC transporter ATP-binding protein
MPNIMDASSAPSPLIAVESLTVRFSVKKSAAAGRRPQLQAVEGFNLHIGAGESVGLVGESGSGKTTIGRVLAGIQRPSAGKVLLRGERVDFSRPGPLQRAAQMVFQDPASSLNPRLRIGTQIAEPLRGHLGLRSPSELRARVGKLLVDVGLSPEDARRYPHQFSGGQRQRIALARALAISPALLVADEPVAGLDVASQAEITALLKTLHSQERLAILLISHDLAGISTLATRVLVLYLGRLVEEGPTGEVVGKPAHPYTKALYDAAPRLKRQSGERRILLAGDPPSPLNPPEGCVFHPRCPFAFEHCSKEIPPMVQAGPAHEAACFLLENRKTMPSSS